MIDRLLASSYSFIGPGSGDVVATRFLTGLLVVCRPSRWLAEVQGEPAVGPAAMLTAPGAIQAGESDAKDEHISSCSPTRRDRRERAGERAYFSAFWRPMPRPPVRRVEAARFHGLTGCSPASAGGR